MSHLTEHGGVIDEDFYVANLNDVSAAGVYGTIWELRALNPHATANTYSGPMRCFGIVADEDTDFTWIAYQASGGGTD